MVSVEKTRLKEPKELFYYQKKPIISEVYKISLEFYSNLLWLFLQNILLPVGKLIENKCTYSFSYTLPSVIPCYMLNSSIIFIINIIRFYQALFRSRKDNQIMDLYRIQLNLLLQLLLIPERYITMLLPHCSKKFRDWTPAKLKHENLLKY